MASIARALSVAELVHASRVVMMGDPVEAYSQWETIGDRKRIVTWTRVLMNESVLGNPESEVLVQTLGGRVGKIGQIVHGEAVLRLNERCVLFLQDTDDGVTRVTAMAQGHYRMLADARGVVRLNPSNRLGTLLPNPKRKNLRPAVSVLKDLTFGEARDIIVKATKQ